jgi:hypothetical protein
MVVTGLPGVLMFNHHLNREKTKTAWQVGESSRHGRQHAQEFMDGG